jgi:hypothetical protein
MAKYVTVNPNAISGQASLEPEITANSTSVPSDGERYSVPFFILRNQAYYWSLEWQRGEAEADAELKRGEAHAFDNPEDALRWLDDPEDQ